MFQASFFDNKRQRPNNRTFVSSNIQNVFSNYYGVTEAYPVYKKSIPNPSNIPSQSLTRSNSIHNPESYNEKILKKTKDISLQKQSTTHRTFSNLSKYGSNSLSNLLQPSDRQIYEKQLKRYNIISNNDKQTSETIKRYPKYHLQTIDDSQKRRKALIEGRMESYNQFNKSLLNNKRQGALYSNPVLASLSEQSSMPTKKRAQFYNPNNNDEIRVNL